MPKNFENCHGISWKLSLNIKQWKICLWVDTFGNAQAKVIPLDLSENQFQIYNKISRDYSHSFLFESLSGPEVLAETSVMGFDPKIIFKGYYDKVEIIENNQTTVIKTNEPFTELKKLLGKSNNQKYRYLGGAEGVVNYDSIKLIENISNELNIEQPIMEFGIYDDGLLFDNVFADMLWPSAKPLPQT